MLSLTYTPSKCKTVINITINTKDIIMKNKYLSLLFASFLIASGCETIGGSSSSSNSPSYEYGDSKQANLQGYLQNEIGDRIYFETDKHNINSASAYTLESQANWLKSTPGFQINY